VGLVGEVEAVELGVEGGHIVKNLGIMEEGCLMRRKDSRIRLGGKRLEFNGGGVFNEKKRQPNSFRR
jgi:hypothetical protein